MTSADGDICPNFNLSFSLHIVRKNVALDFQPGNGYRGEGAAGCSVSGYCILTKFMWTLHSHQSYQTSKSQAQLVCHLLRWREQCGCWNGVWWNGWCPLLILSNFIFSVTKTSWWRGWAAVLVLARCFCLLKHWKSYKFFFSFFLVCGRSELKQTYRAWAFPRHDRALGQELKGGALPGLSCCPGRTRIK